MTQTQELASLQMNLEAQGNMLAQAEQERDRIYT